MAYTRMVKTKMWSDSWFVTLSKPAQLLFVYLITNENTRISGFYELPLFKITSQFGWSATEATKVLKEVYPKVAYHAGWVVIPKYPEHQNVTNNERVMAAIEKELKDVPADVLNLKSEIINHKSEAIDSLSIGYATDKNGSTEPETHVESKRGKTVDKETYGEFGRVKLTREEHQKLIERMGEKNTNVMIDELDAYIASKGKKYSSHYATILTWARRRVGEMRAAASKPKMI